MPRPTRSALLIALLGCVGPGLAFGQGKAEVKANYTKFDYRITMRDGVRLFTSVYVPKDPSKTYPILLNRTPYSVAPYGVDRYRDNLGPSPLFGKSRYIVAYQDVRGCNLSEGKFVDIRPQVPFKKGPRDIDESSDAYDTIDWLVKNVAGNNGKVGIWGISYPGFYAAAGVIDAHPALKAASPQAPLVDWFLGDDVHHNGALFLQQEFNFEANFGPPRAEPGQKSRPRFEHRTADAYRFFFDLGPLSNVNDRYFKGEHPHWQDVIAHGTYDDFWKARALLPHLNAIKPAVLTVGGWFDTEDLYGPLNTYKRIEATSPGGQNSLESDAQPHRSSPRFRSPAPRASCQHARCRPEPSPRGLRPTWRFGPVCSGQVVNIWIE